MSALAFDPRAFRKMHIQERVAPNPPKAPNRDGPAPHGLGGLAGLGGGAFRKSAFEVVPEAPSDAGWTALQTLRDARLPLLGSLERTRLDHDHAAMLAGLLAGYRRHAGGGR